MFPVVDPASDLLRSAIERHRMRLDHILGQLGDDGRGRTRFPFGGCFGGIGVVIGKLALCADGGSKQRGGGRGEFGACP